MLSWMHTAQTRLWLFVTRWKQACSPQTHPHWPLIQSTTKRLSLGTGRERPMEAGDGSSILLGALENISSTRASINNVDFRGKE
uniref:Uncharacterized protein n=1 Tax=Parascaris equorum TaxID=6256 RepID=A0A914RZD4_PAREQ